MTADHKANAEALDVALYGKPDIYTPPEEFMPRRAAIAVKLAELYPDRVAVDHEAEAERVNDYFKMRQLSDSDVIRLGQMNATLALVKQQRIANLIAVATAEANLLAPLSASSPFIPVFAQIREGLGI